MKSCHRLRRRLTVAWSLTTMVGLVTATAASSQATPNPDWASLGRYREANATLAPPAPGEARVVFYGNSITDAWARFFPEMFPGEPYVGRGISGQTTPQMLVRFRQDVIALKPAVVVILAGTNDIAGNTGPSTQEMIEDNLISMVELARANGIEVVLSSVLPAADYPWRPGLNPGPKIAALNAWMRGYAREAGVVYLDYYSAMVDDGFGLRSELSRDGVHPNEAGYRIMAPLAEAAIARALGRIETGLWSAELTPMHHPDIHTPLGLTVSEEEGGLVIEIHGPDDIILPTHDITASGAGLVFSFLEPEKNVPLRCDLRYGEDGVLEGRCTDSDGKWALLSMRPPSAGEGRPGA